MEIVFIAKSHLRKIIAFTNEERVWENSDENIAASFYEIIYEFL